MEPNSIVDLHVHLVKGISVLDVLKEAEHRCIELISIIQHNSVKAYREIQEKELDKCYPGTIITGIEMRFVYKGLILDMLGYGFDFEKLEDSKWMNPDNFEAEKYYFSELKRICSDLKIKLDPDLTLMPGQFANETATKNMFKHQENHKKLSDLGMKEDDHYIVFWREHMCNPESPFYIDKKQFFPDLKEVSELIRGAGGKVFLAHPFAYYLSDNKHKQVMEEIAASGYVDGLECMHKDFGADKNRHILTLCKSHDLYTSGGSDFHGGRTLLGTADDNRLTVPYALVEEWVGELLNNQENFKKDGRGIIK